MDTPTDRRLGSPGPSDIDQSRSRSPTAPLWLPKPPARGSGSRKLTGFRSENLGSRPEVDKSTPSSRLLVRTAQAEDRGDSSSPAPPRSGYSVFRNTGPNGRRTRPETSHQKAVATQSIDAYREYSSPQASDGSEGRPKAQIQAVDGSVPCHVPHHRPP